MASKKATTKAPKEPADTPKPKGKGNAKDDGPKEELLLGDLGGSVTKIGLGVGALCLAGAAGLGSAAGDNFKHFFHSYLVAFWFGLAITLGGLFWILIQHLTRSQWSPVVRRVAEILTANAWLFALLALPIIVPVLMGNTALYRWNDPEIVHASHLLEHKASYLNRGFFAVRWAVYFAIWIGLSLNFLKKSVEQDATGDKAITRKLFAISAPGMLLFALSISFAAIDTIMSLEPEWFSTIFGVYLFAGAQMSFHCVLGLVLMFLQKNGKIEKSVTVEHYHDIGKMTWAFLIFWAYIGFSQFMLIWYADIPEETHWYHVRFEPGWRNVSLVLALGHFVLPFFGMMSRFVKRSKPQLAFWSIWLLVFQYVDLYWLVMPSLDAHHAPFHIMDLLAWFGVIGLMLGNAARMAGGLNLRPTRDPRLKKSLAFENY